jgi:hypothetical protein
MGVRPATLQENVQVVWRPVNELLRGWMVLQGATGRVEARSSTAEPWTERADGMLFPAVGPQARPALARARPATAAQSAAMAALVGFLSRVQFAPAWQADLDAVGAATHGH